MITNIYVLICAAVFLYIQFIDVGDKLSTALRLGAFYPPNIREKKEYWRFITCNFIHIDFLHFLMNAYALYQLGHFFESLLGLLGYLYLIVISMIFSSLMCYSASQISSRYDHTITLGASGIVYGFFGSIVALGLLVGGPFMALLQDFLLVIVINVAYTLFYPQISKAGHLGGFIGGVFATVILVVLKVI